ncbi:zinc-dependent peptidase [Fulvivirga kasyanovii]|uniref:zinc-dependent peptidase n=1 Tax=Fulvivirga kasyanovii TaxID=396812 RepID=UPI0012BD4809|nr:zinc-dependent peptidase [Fulvivirga kasyanovii]
MLSIPGEAFSFIKKHQKLPGKYQRILQNYSSYYNLLSQEDKDKFQARVHHFIYSKRFIPRGFSKVTDEMKVLISAAAIQLTFGLPQVYLAHFDKILIYPDTYYSTINKTYHVGEVNPRMGAIILSWKSFVDGYADPTDSYNVGIHELAHAIHFENRIRNSEFDFLDAESLYILGKIAAAEIPKLQKGEPHFFRSYAGTNEHEFFAVALEYFFERPVEFREALPLLYKTLTRLLNQDPAKRHKLS